MHWLLILVWLSQGYYATPLQVERVPLYVGRSILHQKGRLPHPSFWHGGYLPISLPPFYLACLLWPSSMIGSIPLGVHYPPASIGIDIIPSTLSMCSIQSLQPNHFTCDLHQSSVDILVDVHGRSHNFPFSHPREALLVGHWVTTLPLSSCGILFSSPLTEVVFHGMGLVHLSHVWLLPIHQVTPISDAMRRSQFWWRTHDLPVSSSLHKRGCQLQFDAPPPKSLLPTYPWSSSFPSRHLPLLVQGHQVSGSLCLYFCHSTISISMLLQLIGLVPPTGQSSIYPSQKLHTCPHT